MSPPRGRAAGARCAVQERYEEQNKTKNVRARARTRQVRTREVCTCGFVLCFLAFKRQGSDD